MTLHLHTRRVARLVLLLALSAAAGCGGGAPKLVPVSGTVTANGQPMPEGTIIFKTVQTGATDSLPVKDGRFEGNVEPGERRVEINSYRTKVVGSEKMKGEVQENLIHDRYNLNSKLTATVNAPGPNAFTFDVKTK